jgi:hypothetical protein
VTFDPRRLAADSQRTTTRYERRLADLERAGTNTNSIRKSVERTSQNLKGGASSFVIYGEPQSGKTEMMIALTAKLLDERNRVIIILVNDNVQLLRQNLRRFQEARLHPAPKHFENVLPTEISLASGEWIVFCKKNTHDLQKLIEKTRAVRDGIVVIDDEADYATPNAKVNKKERTRINSLVGDLLGKKGTYIGVTATPARLNLNNTFENQAEQWVIFEPHGAYYGHKIFFPPDFRAKTPPFKLTLLPDDQDVPKYLREAIFRFLVNVAQLNTAINDSEKNYCMLVHTSGIRVDHSADFKQVLGIFSALNDAGNKDFDRYYKQIHDIAEAKYPGRGEVLARYIFENVGRYVPVVMNSDQKGDRSGDYETATNPTTPFTVAIGGNIVSRGVTFSNLLSMFFTRDVKHKIQQDTYIQRARMFGTRGAYVEHFELTIPKELYADWNRCFLFHSLALAAIEDTGHSPLWLEDRRIAATASASVDRATVDVESGEMSFARFNYDAAAVEKVCSDESLPARERLIALQALVGKDALPEYLATFILSLCPDGDASIAIHDPSGIAGRKDKTINHEQIRRVRGFIGTPQLERGAYPKAVHHLKVFFNGTGKARVFYKYSDESGIRMVKSRGKGATQ